MKLLQGTIFLKIAALIFAIFCYFLIHEEINRANIAQMMKTPDTSLKLLKPTTKYLPITIHTDSPPDGYRVLTDKIVVNPDHLVVVGPEVLLADMSSVDTAILDISQSVKTVTTKVPLTSVAGTPLSGEPFYVQVTVPIEKIEPTTT